MADYNINAVTRRVVFTGSAGVGPYAFSFEVLDENDVAVYFNATKLTLTTDYTVTINANGTGSVTLVVNVGGNIPATPTGSDQVIIVGARDIERVTDFVTAGDLLASSLNEQLDALTIFDQQVAEENKRGMRAPVYDPALVEDGGVVDMTLPAKADRAGKFLAFNADGNPVASSDVGEWEGNWAAGVAYEVGDQVVDTSNSNIYRVNNAHTSSGTVPLSTNANSAYYDLVVDLSVVQTAETNAANSATAAATSATNAGNAQTAAETAKTAAETAQTAAETAKTGAETAQTAAESARDATLLAYDNFDDRYLGVFASDPTVDNDGDALVAGSLYFNSTDGAMKVYTGSAWVAAYVSGTGFLATTGGTMTGDITLTGSNIVSASNANVNIVPNGTGDVTLQADTVQVGDNNANATVTTNGTGDLILNTNAGTDSGSITIADGVNGNISVTPNGTGQIALGNFTLDADQSVGSGQDNYVLTYDHASTSISLEATGGTLITKATSDPTTTTNGTQGDLYLNKTSGEMWCLTDATTDANVWTNIGDGSGDIRPTYTAKLLLVAGGGGGGTTSGGGGGGGEVLFASSFTLTKGNTYSVTIGAGGAGAVYNTSASTVGGNTSFGSAATAIGGGGGGTAATSPTVGGSGGGASSASGSTGAAASGTSVSGFTTYGNDGGDNAGGTASAAGGGGAGGAGGNAGVSGNVGGVGGVGIDLSSHFGTSVGADNGYFAGGGGGGSQSNVGGGAAAGGLGGGGTAQASASTGQAGTANTGGGGAGGGWSNNYGDGGNGGSGVVIIRYSGSQQGTGGTVTSPSGDTMHVFTSSGTFTA